MFSLDDETHSFPFRVDSAEPRDIRSGHHLPHRCTCRDRFPALRQPHLRSLFRCAIGVRCLLVPRRRRVHRILFLASGASGSRDPTVGRGIPAYLSFLLPKPPAGVQHIRDIAPRADCIERQPFNQSMKPTPKFLTHSLPLVSAFGLPIYVARVPAAPLKLTRCPHSLAASLAALPSMSLTPSAPFSVLVTDPAGGLSL